MRQVKFKYDIRKDAWSWVVIAKDKGLWGLDWKFEVGHIPKNLLKRILEANIKDAVKLTEEHLKKDRKREYRYCAIKEEMKSLESVWKLVEKKYFKALADMLGKPIYSKEFSCFWTTGFMCPYNEKGKWFMVSLWRGIPDSITTICHEILHLQFLYYYRGYLKKKGLNNSQIEHLKEALTFLLNESEFDEVVLSTDMGYPVHQKLRKELRRVWKEKQSFAGFMEVAVKIVKADKEFD